MRNLQAWKQYAKAIDLFDRMLRTKLNSWNLKRKHKKTKRKLEGTGYSGFTFTAETNAADTRTHTAWQRDGERRNTFAG